MRLRMLLSVLTAMGLGSSSALVAADTKVSVRVGEGRGSDAEAHRLGKSSVLAAFEADWPAYKARFVGKDGRVQDNGNGGLTHSESQGYGLLLAVTANDREGFERIWSWTRTHLLVRDDGLAAWKWDPVTEEVADRNNATDGDILIAWALAVAARRFGRPDYRSAAERLADAIGSLLIRPSRFGPILMPAVAGFGPAEQPDGPVVNLSYWIFPAFSELALLAPGYGWFQVKTAGLELIRQSRFGPLRLPGDWVALGRHAPAPARNFRSAFGYDAIRLPLYLAWDGQLPDVLRHLSGLWNEASDVGPFVIDLGTGTPQQALKANGYRLLFALAACASGNPPRLGPLLTTQDDLYYPESLRLLCLAALQERNGPCP